MIVAVILAVSDVPSKMEGIGSLSVHSYVPSITFSSKQTHNTSPRVFLLSTVKY